MLKSNVLRASAISQKLRPMILAAIASGNDARLAVLVARSNRVLTIQRDANLAAGMPGKRFEPMTIQQVKAIAIAKGVS